MIDSEFGRLLRHAVLLLFSITVLHPRAAPGQEFPIPTKGSFPFGIAKGSDGNLWFTENSGGKIGRITTAGAITEFLVPSSASGPYGIAPGPDGNLWFTEGNNSAPPFNGNKIGRITPAGVITEFPIPTPDSTPYGITSGLDGNLWFSEHNGNKIGRITPAGVITEFSIPTPNSNPSGIALGPDGNLWFTEGNVSQIGRITPGGVITEFSSVVAFASQGITAGPDGSLWFVTTGRVGRITTAGVVTGYSLSSGSLGSSICLGPDANLWYTNPGRNTLGRITTAGVITEFPIPTANSAPFGITAGPDAQLWFVEHNANQIGRMTVNGFPPSASIAAPPSVCAATGGNAASVPDAGPGASYLWSISNGTITAGAGTGSITFSSGATGAVGLSVSVMNGAGSAVGSKSVSISGFCPVFAEFPLPPDPSGFTPAPTAITPGPDGNLWFTDTNNAAPKIGRITTAGALTLFPLPAGMSIPLGIGTGPDGNLWYTRTPFNGGTDEIGRITTSGSIVEYPLAGPTNPGGIVAGPDGALWFAVGVCPGGFNCTVGRITTSGTITRFPVNEANNDITVGPDGALWFTEWASLNSIGRITTSGALTEYPLPTPNAVPEWIALGPDGALWFTEYGGNAIGRITTSGVITEYPLPTPHSFPTGISGGPDGNVWFTEFDYDSSCSCYRDPPRIGQITPAGQITEFIAPTPRSGPWGITTGPDGRLWFTESYAGRIARMTVPTSHPVVTSIAPATGSPFGGTPVIIRGTNFVQGASVFIGGAAPLEAAVIDSTTIFATTAPHTPGASDVVVTDPDSSSGALLDGYIYLMPTPAPTVSSVTPPSGPAAGGASVMINGVGFAPGATVSFGGVAAASVNVMNDTTLTAVTGPHNPGFVDVTVTNAASLPGTLSSGYQYVNSPISFFTLTPCRVVDTRGAGGPYGAPWLAANSTRSFGIAGQCSVPTTARAVSINVTITQPTALGDLRLYPGGAPLPLVSTINYRPGQTRANNAVAPLGAAGDLAVHCDQASGTVQFIVDVNGYFQ